MMGRRAVLMAVVLFLAAVSHSALPQAQAQTLEARIRDYAREHNFNGTILVQHDDYGYGLWIAGIEVWGKQYRVAHRPGSIRGANAVLLRFLNEDLTVIILSSTNATNIDAFSFLIGRTIIE